MAAVGDNFAPRITEVSQELAAVGTKLEELTKDVLAKREGLFKAPLEGDIEGSDWQDRMATMKADFDNLAKIFGMFGRHVAPKIRDMDSKMDTLRLTMDNMSLPYNAYVAHFGEGDMDGQQKIAIAIQESGGFPIVSSRFQGFTERR